MTQQPRPQRRLWLIPLGLMISTSAIASLQTRITAINSIYSTTHNSSITVQAGDTVSLTADQVDVDYNGNIVPQNRNVEDFTYRSDAGDSCDPNYDCTGTNFEVTQYGVNFYVPYSIGQQVTITVQNRQDGTYDQLVLTNSNYSSGYVPPTGSYSDPTQYPNEDFDYNRGLAGQGRWVYVDGERVFVPYSHTDDWQPYQHGHWYWTTYGWTWYSYDPWGWVTDHYGYWRHHGTYRWVWQPFPETRWYPAVVTFFHTNEGMGWYPYWSGYSRGYVRGHAAGYTDGYWDGFRAGLNTNTYHWGGTYVRSSNFCGTNIYNVRITNVSVYYGNAYASQWYGPVLAARGYANPRAFVEARIGRTVVDTPINITQRSRYGGGRIPFVHPATPVNVPQQYRDAARWSQDRVSAPGARVPVGSVVRPGGDVRRPSAPVVVAPRVPDGRGDYRPMPPRTGLPVGQPRPENPMPNRGDRSGGGNRPDGGDRARQPSSPGPSNPAPDRSSRPTPSQPNYPSQPSAPAPQRPTQPAPTPDRSGGARQPSSPAPSNPAPDRSSRPAPAPMPNRPSNPAPDRPSRSTPAPVPSRPSNPNPAPDRSSRPTPSQPNYPAPQRPTQPAPTPDRSDRAGGGARQPSSPSRQPSSPAPSNPRPSRPPGYSTPSRPSQPGPAPSRPTSPNPGRGGGGRRG